MVIPFRGKWGAFLDFSLFCNARISSTCKPCRVAQLPQASSLLAELVSIMKEACLLRDLQMTTTSKFEVKAVPRQPRQVAGDAGRRLPSSFAFIFVNTIPCRTHSIHQRDHRPRRALSHQQAPIPSMHQPPLPARSHSPRRPVSPQTIRVQVKLLPPHSPIWMSPFQMSLLPLTRPVLVRILSKPVLSEWISQDHPRYPIDSIMIDHRSSSKSLGLVMDIELILYKTSRRGMQWVHNLLDLHRLQILLRTRHMEM